MKFRILVGLACHNRREITKRCLHLLQEIQVSPLHLDICVFDDGSQDGTSNMIRKEFPSVEIVSGSGENFWAKSMSILHNMLNDQKHDGFLMLNDDVQLFDDSLQRLYAAIYKYPNSIIVGAMVGFQGVTTYSGLRCIKSGNYYRMITQIPSDVFVEVDSFVGNFVYIPKSVSNLIGFLNGNYSHHYADVEFGIRASKSRISILLMPDFVGICESNTVRTRYMNQEIPLIRRFKELNSRFCFPIRDHLMFYRNIGGKLWIYYFVRSYSGKILMTFFPFLNHKIFQENLST